MSSAGVEGGSRASPAEWARLERAVRRLAAELDRLRVRCADAERRRAELEAAVRDLSEGRMDPFELSRRLESAEQENRELRRRQEKAAELTQRLRARLEFLEDR